LTNFVISQNAAGIWPIFDFSKMAVIRHFGFVVQVLRPPMKSIRQSLLLCKIWLKLVQ